jgi:hypothetical protein
MERRKSFSEKRSASIEISAIEFRSTSSLLRSRSLLQLQDLEPVPFQVDEGDLSHDIVTPGGESHEPHDESVDGGNQMSTTVASSPLRSRSFISPKRAQTHTQLPDILSDPGLGRKQRKPRKGLAYNSRLPFQVKGPLKKLEDRSALRKKEERKALPHVVKRGQKSPMKSRDDDGLMFIRAYGIHSPSPSTSHGDAVNPKVPSRKLSLLKDRSK